MWKRPESATDGALETCSITHTGRSPFCGIPLALTPSHSHEPCGRCPSPCRRRDAGGPASNNGPSPPTTAQVGLANSWRIGPKVAGPYAGRGGRGATPAAPATEPRTRPPPGNAKRLSPRVRNNSSSQVDRHGRHRPNFGNAGQKWPNCGPSLDNIGPKLPEPCQSVSTSGPNLAHNWSAGSWSDPTRPTLGRNWPMFGEHRPRLIELVHILAKFGPARSTFDQVWSRSEEQRQTSARSRQQNCSRQVLDNCWATVGQLRGSPGSRGVALRNG